jgi:hypothetical protein
MDMETDMNREIQEFICLRSDIGRKFNLTTHTNIMSDSAISSPISKVP